MQHISFAKKIQVEPARGGWRKFPGSKDCDAIGRCFGISKDTNSSHVDGLHHVGTSTDTLLAC